jgi:hypothetical protein
LRQNKTAGGWRDDGNHSIKRLIVLSTVSRAGRRIEKSKKHDSSIAHKPLRKLLETRELFGEL